MAEITTSAVREIGHVLDVDYRRVIVGHDCDAVTIQIAYGLVARFDASKRDEFTRLYFEAERQAEAWAKDHAGVSDG